MTGQGAAGREAAWSCQGCFVMTVGRKGSVMFIQAHRQSPVSEVKLLGSRSGAWSWAGLVIVGRNNCPRPGSSKLES